jgi:hypothetical protein
VQLFLPIADIPVNVFLILAMGAAVGFVSGMFGIGGGFLMTPLLIFVGTRRRSRSPGVATSQLPDVGRDLLPRAPRPGIGGVLDSGSIGTAMGAHLTCCALGQPDLIVLSYVILLRRSAG